MSPRPASITFVDDEDRRRVVVEWIMSSVCNYKCSYCPVYLHDGRVRWPRYADIMRFCTRVRDHYAAAPLTFLLSGGEITLFRDLKPLAKELKTLGADVAILTNGSRPPSWWRDTLGLFDEVIISYHHEQADREHLLTVARILAGHSLVQMNIVIDPAAFDLTMAFAAQVENETNATVNRKIMFLDGWKRPAPYSATQHQRLADALATERTDPRTVLKGSLIVGYDDGHSRVVSPLKLIGEDLNHWNGWHCAIGETTLFVRFDEVWRAACREGGRIGSIYDEDLRLPAHGIHCTATSCNCIAGIKAAKFRPEPDQPVPSRARAALRTDS